MAQNSIANIFDKLCHKAVWNCAILNVQILHSMASFNFASVCKENIDTKLTQIHIKVKKNWGVC